MSRPNKCLKDENGKDVWISRSAVVIPIVFKKNENGDVFALIERRGPAVSHSGEWCCPCGYIDWDETLEEACCREVKEETGIELKLQDISFFEVATNKFSNNQTIDLWYTCWTDDDFDLKTVETKDEVADLKWLPVGKLSPNGYDLTIYLGSIKKGFGEWAFKDHHKYISKMLSKRFNVILVNYDEHENNK